MTFCKPLARVVCASSFFISPLTFLKAAPREESTAPPITSPSESLFAMQGTCMQRGWAQSVSHQTISENDSP
ncbi:hypothetical protein D3C75_698940 [compost metagenome]